MNKLQELVARIKALTEAYIAAKATMAALMSVNAAQAGKIIELEANAAAADALMDEQFPLIDGALDVGGGSVGGNTEIN